MLGSREDTKGGEGCAAIYKGLAGAGRRWRRGLISAVQLNSGSAHLGLLGLLLLVLVNRLHTRQSSCDLPKKCLQCRQSGPSTPHVNS